MRASTTLVFIFAAAVLAASAPAQAMFAPADAHAIALLPDENAFASTTSGGLREQAYFSAPQTPLATGRVIPCRLQLNVFEKTRLARSCN
jgi:hypothetical protein